MCFGKRDHYDPSAEAAKPSNYPPEQPTYAPTPSAKMTAIKQQEYAPPPGPPPSHSQAPAQAPISELSADAVGPPPGPPPSRTTGQADDYAPPPGPPPSKKQDDDYMAPPPGPPPGKSAEGKDSKPLHDWESVVPDTSLFPPPPDIFSGWDRSPANNASEAEAQAGDVWCRQHHLTPPIQLDGHALGALEYHNIRLMTPSGYRGILDWREPGVWAGKTETQAADTCIIGYPPLYCVSLHSPLAHGGARRTVYYEVKIRSDSRRDETSLALGFTALPYPSFRLPGWHRGSVAVHGDDGHRYVNDMWGGKSFTAPFKRGETYGIGMHFTPVGGKIEVVIFLTRNGVESGSWNLHEETDAQQDLPVTGLEGFHDLSCAIGTFNAVSFEVVFEPSKWAYKGVV